MYPAVRRSRSPPVRRTPYSRSQFLLLVFFVDAEPGDLSPLDAGQLREQVAGLKAGDIKDLLQDSPGIVDVQVAYSPVWVSKAPKDVKKITIIIDGMTK